MNKIDILGVQIDDVSMDQAMEKVKEWMEEGKKHYIVTPNPEFIMAAQSDSEFRKVLNKADLAIPDGVGLKLSGKVKNTTPGVDLMEEMVKYAADNGLTVGFLGGRDLVAEEAAERLRSRYPNLKVSFASGDIKVDQDGRELESSGKNQELSKKKLDSKFLIPASDILFVAFGRVKQEKWIVKNLPSLPVRIAMGVGGSFDYLSGRVRRAPKGFRKLGLEWLFRLLTQPWRIKRQLALAKFVWEIVIH